MAADAGILDYYHRLVGSGQAVICERHPAEFAVLGTEVGYCHECWRERQRDEERDCAVNRLLGTLKE